MVGWDFPNAVGSLDWVFTWQARAACIRFLGWHGLVAQLVLGPPGNTHRRAGGAGIADNQEPAN
eukprot:12896234-Prorocentrum_lima.AAC.1